MDFKVSKKCLYDLKTFSSQNLNSGTVSKQRSSKPLRKMQKFANVADPDLERQK
jgi:hypothetical protein